MPETVHLFRVLLAAPSDVMEEHQLIAGVINEWNVQHGDNFSARIEIMNWRTHAHPETGRRPQALINRQFADRADIVIAVFWRRLGSPTGKAASGTVEEIERARRRGKKVMVYFSERHAPSKVAAAPRERLRMERFKRSLGHNALFGEYADLQEFERVVRKDLALVMREIVGRAGVSQ
jgi:hypothetical protein